MLQLAEEGYKEAIQKIKPVKSSSRFIRYLENMNANTQTFTERIEKLENIVEHKIKFQINEVQDEIHLLETRIRETDLVGKQLSDEIKEKASQVDIKSVKEQMRILNSNFQNQISFFSTKDSVQIVFDKAVKLENTLKQFYVDKNYYQNDLAEEINKLRKELV